MPVLALIHTGPIFLTVEPLFHDLCREVLPGVRIVDLLDGTLLADVMTAGTVQPSHAIRFANLVRSAEVAGCDAALSLCSSLGPAADAAGACIPLLKVDAPMAAEAAGFARVAVLATVPTTLPPTCALIAAQPATRTICTPRLIAGAFAALLAGDRDRHDALVEDAARAAADQADAIVLAQASMARLATHLAQATGRPVLASPCSGIAAAARLLGVAAC